MKKVAIRQIGSCYDLLNATSYPPLANHYSQFGAFDLQHAIAPIVSHLTRGKG